MMVLLLFLTLLNVIASINIQSNQSGEGSGDDSSGKLSTQEDGLATDGHDEEDILEMDLVKNFFH